MPTYIPTDQNTTIEWRTESLQKPPVHAVYIREQSAATILKNAYTNTASIWQGDFHNAKQVLSAIKKRIRKPAKSTIIQQAPAIAFHHHRMQQAQQSRLLNMLAIEIQPGFQLDLPRAPDIHAALTDIYPHPNEQPFAMPLNLLLGLIGAHEWHKKGVDIAQIGGKIHVPFGVFSPLRGEYLQLAAEAPLPNQCQTAFDIGTGSGVLAILLAKRGIPHITATDTNPNAINCARRNIEQSGTARQITLQQTDLFPEGKADLIICNPPWLPAKPTSAIETALYDPDHQMLKGFLAGIGKHLNPQGEAWLIISDLAEHLGLRTPQFLHQSFQTASLKLLAVHSIKPRHAKAADTTDPLSFARNQETTYLYRLSLT
ncbi:methyltransferase [Neisseria sp. S1]|uniref:methyltransferase n=1 Tax=Neisseria sp. S1 TaxID=3318354 RepID=UPI003A86BDF3